MKYILILLGFLGWQAVHAQQPDLVFHHITEKEGLSYNIVNCFLKDSKGMLWIGTYNGLNRYDGAHFFVYRNEKNSSSLPNNTVHRLAEDKQGNIWGATEEGIFCFNQQSNQFQNYAVPGETGWSVTLNILCDQAGTIWTANGIGLLKLNKKTNRFEQAPVAANTLAPAQKIRINKNGLAESPDGRGIWIATAKGLMYYNKVSRQYSTRQNTTDSLLFTPREASAICVTQFGHYWFFDNPNKRLVAFDPVSQKIKYSIQNKELASMQYVATIFEDGNHMLWVSTWGYRVYTIDYLHGGQVTSINHKKEDRSSIAGNFFWAAMQEPDGSVWLGTVGGISRCNTTHAFYKVHHFSDSLFSTTGAAVEFVAEDKSDSSWWMATSKKLLLHYQPRTAKITRYNLDDMPVQHNNHHPAHINSLLFLQHRTLMFTDWGAWERLGTGQFQPFHFAALPSSVVLREGIMTDDSTLYCTDSKQLWRCNLRTETAIELPYQSAFTIRQQEPLIRWLNAGKRGKLWMVIGPDWVSYTGPENLHPVKFASQEKDGGNGYYTNMTIDEQGDLWICKKGDGLFYYNTRTKKYRQIKQSDGLVMDHVMAVAADQQGLIWTGAYNQFSVFNPVLNSFYNFTLPLSTNNYGYTNFMLTLSNGHVLGTVADKLVEFFPDRLKAYAGNSAPLISSLTVAGVEQRIPGQQQTLLEPDQNSLLIKFGLLADPEASPYDMLYMMEGAENTWTVAGSHFEASYNSLAPGSYRFRVKAVAKDKSWQTKETTLSIHIATPFTKSWWFYGMLVSLLAILIYGIYRYRMHQQKQLLLLEGKAQLLEKEKTLVLYESLKQQLNPHFLFNSLTSLSGLIETDQKMAGTFLEQMSKTYRYILKSSDSETVALKDEIAFVKLYIQLQQTRFKTGLVVEIAIPEEDLHCKIAPVTLQNMIENAIKHNIIDVDTPLVIRISVDDDYLVIKNNLQRKNVVETSNQQGLENLRSLYRYLTSRPIDIIVTDSEYCIRIPLL